MRGEAASSLDLCSWIHQTDPSLHRHRHSVWFCSARERYQVANERNDNFQFYIGIECKVRNLNLIKLQVMMKTEEVSPV